MGTFAARLPRVSVRDRAWNVRSLRPSHKQHCVRNDDDTSLVSDATSVIDRGECGVCLDTILARNWGGRVYWHPKLASLEDERDAPRHLLVLG